MNGNITPEGGGQHRRGWNDVTEDIGRENQIEVWRKGVEAGLYIDKF